MEITSYGDTCLRLRGREGTVVTNPYPRIVGPTGRGLTADIVTYSHPDDQATLGLEAAAAGKRRKAVKDGRLLPTSLESAFLLDSPGEYEVHHVLMTGVDSFRDGEGGTERGRNVCFLYELDNVHVAHLGDIGHLLTQDQVGDLEAADVVCVPIGGSLPAARVAELVAQLDANLVVPMPVDGSREAADELGRFLHEMSVTKSDPVPKLTVSVSSLPTETTVVLLEPRGRS